MGLRINTNTDAINTLRQLTLSQNMFSQSMQRLSSGKRINSAADDAAGYAISQKLLSQSNGLDQAASNAQDGISLVQTANGGLQTIQDMLQRLRQLAVQAANDTNTTSDRQALQAEADAISKEITQIASTTQFNTRNLLDGSMGSIGSATTAALSALGTGITATNSNLKAGSLGTGNYTVTLGTLTVGTASTTNSGQGAGTQIAGASAAFAASQAIDNADLGLQTTSTNPVSVTASGLAGLVSGGSAPTVSGITTGQIAAGTWTITNTTASGAWGAAGNNTIDVTMGGTTYHLKDSTVAGKFDTAASGSIPTGFVVDLSGATTAVNNATATFTVAKAAGVNTSVNQSLAFTDENGHSGTIALTQGETFTQVATAINNLGLAITASVDTTHGAGHIGLALTSNGPNGSGQISVTGSDNALMGLGLEAAAASAASTSNVVTATGSTGTADTMTASYLTGGPAGSATATGTGVQLVNTGWVLSDSGTGFSIDLSKATTSLTSGGSASFSVTNNAVTLQVGANANQNLSTTIGDMRAQALGVQGASANQAVDITSQVKANAAISVIDGAIAIVSSQAASLGAMQNRLQNAISNLNISSQNMQAAYSSITNVNMAQESTNLATAQILQQSGIAMLAQANTSPQSVLKLLG